MKNCKTGILLKTTALILLWTFTIPSIVAGQNGPRARDLGIPFDGITGPNNAITDVDDVLVGHTTLISGEGPLIIGKGPVRTGITTIFPRGSNPSDPVFAGWFALNGNGEMTGTTWVEESGFMEGPMAITNTHSVGVVRDAIIEWQTKHGNAFQPWSLPVVAETYDGTLNDINGFHVTKEHLFAALDASAGGKIEEGNVGGGTGMRCLGFKCGIGTSSRAVSAGERYTVGVLVQANYGSKNQLTIAGVPVGKNLDIAPDQESQYQDRGSIIIVVATDAPLLPHQLKRVARRASLGVARTGGTASNGSGDIFIAFSTGNPDTAGSRPVSALKMLNNSNLSVIFQATVEATEEAIINAMIAAETMEGRDGNRSEAIPHRELQQLLDSYSRLKQTTKDRK
mgnify:FL=1